MCIQDIIKLNRKCIINPSLLNSYSSNEGHNRHQKYIISLILLFPKCFIRCRSAPIISQQTKNAIEGGGVEIEYMSKGSTSERLLLNIAIDGSRSMYRILTIINYQVFIITLYFLLCSCVVNVCDDILLFSKIIHLFLKNIYMKKRKK